MPEPPAAFVVNLITTDPSPEGLAATAAHLTDLIEDSGYVVVSVAPWDRQSFDDLTSDHLIQPD